ncbi:hypothetical protein AVI53_07125 [Piscirickettsia salmonis]|nr:hypothetical protein PSLF89_07450 [Piscirickettsia salmonis LF-89 = ATCC VR-1361]ALY03626.1 hypothetical protein AWE47_12835 [Piscirickettsia salmonis]AMA43190.1 hypothetical protein AWJ11_13065 [Piscirickettsia salmonis]APS60361.1 hypothetical protein AVI53_07125 [Piscirickettsia salmonis]APS63594.1 hypothetical protein AVI54_07095 [Piscirickettsia salmonis]
MDNREVVYIFTFEKAIDFADGAIHMAGDHGTRHNAFYYCHRLSLLTLISLSLLLAYYGCA